MGRNYDWQRCDAMIVHAKPKNGYESLSTCCLDFLGFGKSWKPEGIQNQYMSLVALYVPLDGMNEAGLCVADLICGDNIQIKQDTDKPDLTVTTAIRLLLDRAASVDEAVALLENYDMNSSIGMSHHLAISDSSGRSVVVEYVDGQMIVTDTPVVTNHYLSAGSKFGVGNNLSHARYNKLMSLRDKFHGIMPADEVKLALRSVSYPNITQWSIVYDMEHLSMDFYWQRQFESSYGFSLVRQ